MARKKIREYDSKRLLKEHLKRICGIDLQILSAQVTESTDFKELVEKEAWLASTKLVVKPDMLFGKRGKSGLVALNLDLAQVQDFVKQRLGVEVEMGGCKAPITTLESLKDEGIAVLTNPIGAQLSDPVPGFINGRQFFKVKLLIPTNKALPDHVTAVHPTLGETKVYTVYERISRVCLFCGLIGHEIDSCPDRVRLARIKNSEEGRNRPEFFNILMPKFGPWLTEALKIPKQDQQGPEIPYTTHFSPIPTNSSPSPNSTHFSPNPTNASGTKRNITEALCIQPPPTSNQTQPMPVKKYVRLTSLSTPSQKLLTSPPTPPPSLLSTKTDTLTNTPQDGTSNETPIKRAKAASHNAPPQSV